MGKLIKTLCEKCGFVIEHDEMVIEVCPKCTLEKLGVKSEGRELTDADVLEGLESVIDFKERNKGSINIEPKKGKLN